jgi:hypothetical protein
MTVIINGTTGITNVNGTAAAPAETGTDTDSGIVYGTNTVSLATNGTTALTVNASQVVTLANALPVASGGTGTTSTTFANLTTNVTGTLPIANGGTGTTSTTFANLTTNVTGTLPVANGGTGVTTSTGSGANVLGTSPSISGAVLSSMASSVITSGTAVASTSGTSIDFTGIPSWVKRVTVVFDLTSTSGSSNLLMQIGNGSIINTGYTSLCLYAGGSSNTGSATSTAGCLLTGVNGAAVQATGSLQLVLQTSNTWILSGTLTQVSFNQVSFSSGRIALGGALDRVRITTVNGTDAFDAGTINILYE